MATLQQNTVGRAIVDAQNQLGQGIVDAQNELGNYIVDAKNANGEAIVDAQNYITLQHNALSTWLQSNLCKIFENVGGSCTTFIGPLEEDQSFLPVEFHWPEGQPTMIERLEQIQKALPSGAQNDKNDSASKIIGVLSLREIESEAKDLEAIKGQVDSVESKVDAHSAEIQTKVDAIESKVDAIESKVDAIEGMLSKLMDMFAQE